MQKGKKKLIRITTIPLSLKVLLKHQLRFMNDHFDVLAVSSAGKDLEDVAKQEGVRISAVSMTRSITPIQDLKALWKLYRLFKREDPHIVHTHTPKAGLLGMMAGKMAGVPVRMHTVAGLPLMETGGIKRKILEFVERITYASATGVYPNSVNLAHFILENKFCSREKIKVLGNGSSNGINTEHFKINEDLKEAADKLKEELNLKKEDFVFVFVGRLVKDKGIEELIEAFLPLEEKFPYIRLLLVGPYEEDLDPISEETIKKIKINKKILQVGFQYDVRPYFLISNALVFPSYREGFPNVPMQAGCFHLPSIVSNINGCNEIIIHEKNGLIIPPKNASALKTAMERLLIDKNLYEVLRSNSRKMIEERFDQKYLWNLLLKEYQYQIETNVVPQIL